MKKYLLLGLALLFGSNIVLISGALMNRSGEPVAHLSLTEREVTLPYSYGNSIDDSSVFLRINWRVPTPPTEEYNRYSSRHIDVTEQEFLALGFELTQMPDGTRRATYNERRPLYWALEFDGELYRAELESAKRYYEASIADVESHDTERHQNILKRSNELLANEKHRSSRLFFVEMSQDYQKLVDKYADKSNIVVLSGLTSPSYYTKDDRYSLSLSALTVAEVMVPAEHIDKFPVRQRFSDDGQPAPFRVDVAWGSRLEPWVKDIVIE